MDLHFKSHFAELAVDFQLELAWDFTFTLELNEQEATALPEYQPVRPAAPALQVEFDCRYSITLFACPFTEHADEAILFAGLVIVQSGHYGALRQSPPLRHERGHHSQFFSEGFGR